MSGRGPVNRRTALLVAVAAVFALMTLAPTPGDVGGCQPARPLNEPVFFETKRSIDCERCSECDLHTAHCQRACDNQSTSSEQFSKNCTPLAQDGAVCLRALLASSCSDYAAFVDDRHPTLPTECDFCPLGAADRLGAANPPGGGAAP
ncbi:MAG TPA: hypothetical protein VL137_17280 [Polyangiaceae bacterium]|jgi:hypothetical protein|nr:hypothetical protein [Polyangiaceae bacterium]